MGCCHLVEWRANCCWYEGDLGLSFLVWLPHLFHWPWATTEKLAFRVQFKKFIKSLPVIRMFFNSLLKLLSPQIKDCKSCFRQVVYVRDKKRLQEEKGKEAFANKRVKFFIKEQLFAKMILICALWYGPCRVPKNTRCIILSFCYLFDELWVVWIASYPSSKCTT